MTADQPNGLASLSAQRERARRSMPPPRHPVAPTPSAADLPARDTARPAERSQSQARIDDVPPPAQASALPPPAPEETGATFKVTLYVDRQTDEFMEATRVIGLTSRPKVDVSRSAVVRLALRRLMDEMSPTEVKTILEHQAVRSSGPGRRRR